MISGFNLLVVTQVLHWVPHFLFATCADARRAGTSPLVRAGAPRTARAVIKVVIEVDVARIASPFAPCPCGDARRGRADVTIIYGYRSFDTYTTSRNGIIS